MNSNWNITSSWDIEICNTWCNWWGNWWGNENGWIIPVSIDINNIDTPIITSECLACPCNYVDFANSLNINDKIKAVLRDDSLSTIYSQSNSIYLNDFLN